MKKKGFTLIELLAVIVILAIIALIATPLVLKYIEKSRKESKVDSAYSFVRNLETEIANYSIKNNGKKYNRGPKNGKFYELGDFEDNKDIDTTVKGDKPDTIKVCLSSLGQVDKAMFEYGKYYVSYDGKKGSISDKDTYDNFSCSDNGGPDLTIGAPITFDVDNGSKCDYYTEAQSANEVKSGCMKFYVLNDNGDTVDLILDHNTTNIHAWNTSIDGGNTNIGPDVLLEQLMEDTKSWEGTLTPTNYTRYDDANVDEVEYNIDYKDYTARIITIEEILNLLSFYVNLSDEDKGNWWNLYDDKVPEVMMSLQESVDLSKYGDNIIGAYQELLDNFSETEVGLPKFLYDNLIENCSLDDNGYFACETEGYWTSSSISIYPIEAWYINYMGNIDRSASYGPYMDDVGIRPVIKVSKDKLNK